MSHAFDPISLEVMWNRLVTIAEECENALLRTSFSTVISEARDFACIILNAEGESIAQAPMTVPAFSLSLPTIVGHCRRRFGNDGFQPGDVMITNDPWEGTGHLSDLTVIRPIFRGEQLVGFVAAVGHVSDIGGVIGYHSGRDVFEEGFHIPITKLYEEGRPNQLLMGLLAANVRVPDLVLGDVDALVAALDVGHRRVLEFLEDFNLADLVALSRELGSRAERVMSEALARLPAGRYSGAYEFDGYVEPATIRVSVEIRDGRATIDFTGTSPQVDAGAINAPFVIARAEALYFFQYMLTPSVPACSALFRPITVAAPEGCLMNPRPPVAVKARSKTTFHVPEALFNALAAVLPELVQAASGHSCYVIINGRHGTGRAFNSFYLPGGGMGATAQRDGLNCTLFPTNTTVTPIEVLEVTAPVVVLEKALLPDSGGPGRYRGGASQVVEIQSVSDRSLTLTLRPEDWRRPPAGLLGGKSGAPCQLWLNDEPTTSDLIDFQPGDRLRVHLPGGGGFGPPTERSREALRADIDDALVSAEQAAAEYGYRGER